MRLFLLVIQLQKLDYSEVPLLVIFSSESIRIQCQMSIPFGLLTDATKHDLINDIP